MFRHHVPLQTILSTKGFFANRTEPIHVNSSRAECRLRKRENVAHLYTFSGHKILLFSSTNTTTTTFPLFSFSTTSATATTFLLFSLHHHHHHNKSTAFLHHHQYHHHISIVFPPPPPPHFYCFLSFAHSSHFFFSTRLYKRLSTAILSSFCRNASCSKQQSWFSPAVS